MLEEKRIWLLGAKMSRIVDSSRIKLRPFAMKATEAVSRALASEIVDLRTLMVILGWLM